MFTGASWRFSITLSAMLAKSVSEDFSEPARIARAVGGRTARKKRCNMSTLDEIPECNPSRSAQALDKNCDGNCDHNDWVRKYFLNYSVSEGYERIANFCEVIEA